MEVPHRLVKRVKDKNSSLYKKPSLSNSAKCSITKLWTSKITKWTSLMRILMRKSSEKDISSVIKIWISSFHLRVTLKYRIILSILSRMTPILYLRCTQTTLRTLSFQSIMSFKIREKMPELRVAHLKLKILLILIIGLGLQEWQIKTHLGLMITSQKIILNRDSLSQINMS